MRLVKEPSGLRIVALCVVGLVCGCAPQTEVSGPVAAQPGSTKADSEKADAPPPPVVTTSAPVASSAPTAPPSPRTLELPRETTVLHVGDSFVHSGLTQRLKEHFTAGGIRLIARAEQSTNSMDWAKRMPDAIASTKPDLVIVTLGGNEIGSRHLDVQARAIRRIVSTIGDRPCVWTTPPLWIAESGLFDTLQSNVAPCRFFETDKEVGKFIPRRGDKIHPTMEGGAMWADSLIAFFKRERRGEPQPWSFLEAPESERTPQGIRGPLAP